MIFPNRKHKGFVSNYAGNGSHSPGAVEYFTASIQDGVDANGTPIFSEREIATRVGFYSYLNNLTVGSEMVLDPSYLAISSANATLDNVTVWSANSILTQDRGDGRYSPKTSNVTYGQFSQQGLTYLGESSTAITNNGTITRNLFSGYSQSPYAGSMVFGSNATTTSGVATTASMQADGQTFSIAGTNLSGATSKETGMGFSGTGVQFSYFEDNADGFKTVEYLLSSSGIRITSINNNYTSSVFGETTFEVTPTSTFITTLEPAAITPNTIMNKEMTESLFITMKRMGL